ncbi:succinyl-diaminopimelate desuccinylase [mine drainage metagenome]|uniref:Succinyl-diaminopimelate desuccinylase n=1 Tax=mine drainage metagenome TaxID=410659 RepID=T1DF21_9ZZZZ
MTDPTLELTAELIRHASVTPEDGGCQELIARRLAPLGFKATPLDRGEVSNLWLRRGTGSPLVVLAGHTDVVPPGPRIRLAFSPLPADDTRWISVRTRRG